MNDPAIPPGARRIAVLLPTWVGDCVMATPLLRALRERRPKAHLVGIMRPGLDEILHGGPWLDASIPCELKGPLGPWRVARALRSERPDAVLLLPNSFRSALAARLSGAPVRIGYRRDARAWLLSHSLEIERSTQPMPTIDYYARLGACALGGDALDRRMELFVTDGEARAADRMLDDVAGPFLVLNPGGNRPAKRWPPPRFAAAAAALRASHDLAAVVTGAPGEREVLEAVVGAARDGAPIINLAERGLTLGSLKAVIARAALVITNDTGPRHMAAALGRPLVTLFGPTDHRWTTIGCPHERLLLAEPFLPENLIADDHRRLCRIERITVPDVVAAARSLLSVPGAGNRAHSTASGHAHVESEEGSE